MFVYIQKLTKITLIILLVSLLSMFFLLFISIFINSNVLNIVLLIDQLIVFGCFILVSVLIVINSSQADLLKKNELKLFKKTFCVSCGQSITDQDVYCQNCGFKLPERK